MKPRKAKQNIKNKFLLRVSNRPVKTLKDYFPSQRVEFNRDRIQSPTEPISTDENIMSIFRIMWNTNMLIKHKLNGNAASEARNVHMHSTLKDIYKTIWKLNMLLKNLLNKKTVSEARNEYKMPMQPTLKDVYKTIWKLKYF